VIVTIPFFPGHTDYDRLTVSINSKGRSDGHHLLVVSRRADEEAAMDFEASISATFTSSTHRVIDPPRDRGRYATSNELFRQALTFLSAHTPRKGEPHDTPILWFDPALRASKKGWADAIQAEWFAKGTPKVLAVRKSQANKMKVTWGAVLFSKGYVRDSALLAHLPGTTPWREYLRHEIEQVLVPSKTLFPRAEGSVVSLVNYVKTPRKKEEAEPAP
jgi:hypothetical protein